MTCEVSRTEKTKKKKKKKFFLCHSHTHTSPNSFSLTPLVLARACSRDFTLLLETCSSPSLCVVSFRRLPFIPRTSLLPSLLVSKMCRPPQSQLKAAVVYQPPANTNQQQQQYKQDSPSSSSTSSVLDQIDLIAKLQPQGFDAWLPTIVKQEEEQQQQQQQLQVAAIMPTSPESVCTEATVPQQLDVLSWLNDFEAELASASPAAATAAAQVQLQQQQQPQQLQQQQQQQPFVSMPFSGLQDFETAYMFPPQQPQYQQPQYQQLQQQQQQMYTANPWAVPPMSVPLMPEMQMPMPQTSCCSSGEDDDLSLFQSSPATMAAFTNATNATLFEDANNSSHSLSDSSPSACGGLSASRMKKMRKRRLAQDLSPEELEKTREVNRVAAQRHRQVLKAKRVERIQQAESIQKKTQAMRQQVQEMSLELKTLKRLVVEMYAPGGSRHHMLAAL